MKKNTNLPFPNFTVTKSIESHWRKFLTFAILVLTAGACQKEFEEATANTEAFPPGIVALSFEVETLTIPTLQNVDDATSQ